MKKSMIIVLAVVVSILAACSSPTASPPAPAATKATTTNPASGADDQTRTNTAAMVTVAITPLNLSDKASVTLDFAVALNTHSVNLSCDLTQIATLSNDAGEQVQPTKWNGPVGGGHHREGTLSFPQLKQRGQTLTLTLRGIADVPERTFTWKVN